MGCATQYVEVSYTKFRHRKKKQASILRNYIMFMIIDRCLMRITLHSACNTVYILEGRLVIVRAMTSTGHSKTLEDRMSRTSFYNACNGERFLKVIPRWHAITHWATEIHAFLVLKTRHDLAVVNNRY